MRQAHHRAAKWFGKILIYSPFGSHNCDASFSTFSVNLSFANNRFPRKGWSGVRRTLFFIILLRFWRWRSSDPLVYVLQSYVSMNSTGFNEGKWISHRRSQLSGSPYVRLPTYAIIRGGLYSRFFGCRRTKEQRNIENRDIPLKTMFLEVRLTRCCWAMLVSYSGAISQNSTSTKLEV